MVRSIIVLLSLVSVTMAQVYFPSKTYRQYDTIWIKGTEVKYSKIFAQDIVGEKSIIVSFNDTSAAGIPDDSAAMKVELMQAFNRDADGSGKAFWLFNSHANPDSTSGIGSSNFALWDSLDVLDMDSTANRILKRQAVKSPSGDTVRWTYNNRLDSVASPKIPAAYRSVAPDYSNGFVLKLTGHNRNKKASYVRVLVEVHAKQESK